MILGLTDEKGRLVPDATTELQLFDDYGALRRCVDCRQLLPLDSYHKNKGRIDGLHTFCRSCATIRVQVWRSKNEHRYEHTCSVCGAIFTHIESFASVCSKECHVAQAQAASNEAGKQRVEKAKQHPLRQAWKDNDYQQVIEVVQSMSVIDDTTGCWVWGSLKNSYPDFDVDGKTVRVHRLVFEAKFDGRSLGSQHAHHMCANSACVNPDHLQPVTHRENVAEMMARQSLLARIRELEARLAEVAPGDPLLDVIDVL